MKEKQTAVGKKGIDTRENLIGILFKKISFGKKIISPGLV